MTTLTRTIEIHGTICGPIWWPIGAKGGKPFTATLTRDDSLYEELCALLNDGDFADGGRLTADSYILISHRIGRAFNGGWVHERWIDASELPSIRDFVDLEAYSSDFDPDSEPCACGECEECRE